MMNHLSLAEYVIISSPPARLEGIRTRLRHACLPVGREIAERFIEGGLLFVPSGNKQKTFSVCDLCDLCERCFDLRVLCVFAVRILF